MPIEIRELLIRTLWGDEGGQDAHGKIENRTDENQTGEKQKVDETVDITASLRKMLEQNQER